MASTAAFSPAGLAQLEFVTIPRDFEFRVGKKRYATFKLIACMLSPKIAKELENDPQLTEFRVNIRDPNGYFVLIMDVGYGREVEVTRDNCLFLYRVGEIFESDTIKRAADKFDIAVPTTKDAVATMATMYDLGDSRVSAFTDYIAEHFDDVTKGSEMLRFPVALLTQIFTSSAFRLTTISYEWLKNAAETRPGEVMALFKGVVFHHLADMNPCDFHDFIRYIEEDDLAEVGEDLRAVILSSVRHM